MWEDFIRKNNLNDVKYEAWAFGGAPDRLADLVLCNKKTATSSAYDLYTIANEPLPQAGGYSVILDSKGQAKCIIKTKSVVVLPFNKATETFAFKEGEGGRSLSYWQTVHKDFFSHCLKEAGLAFEEEIKVVCEEFEVRYK